MSIRVSTFASIAAFALCACSADAPTPVLETVAPAALVISVDATGELKSSKATPLMVPGRNWSSRRLVWMAPEGSLVKKGEVIARFSAEEGEQELALALIDLQRNALARAAARNSPCWTRSARPIRSMRRRGRTTSTRWNCVRRTMAC